MDKTNTPINSNGGSGDSYDKQTERAFSHPHEKRWIRKTLRYAAATVLFIVIITLVFFVFPKKADNPDLKIKSDGRPTVSAVDGLTDDIVEALIRSGIENPPSIVRYIPTNNISGFPGELSPKLADTMAACSGDDMLFWIRITCDEWSNFSYDEESFWWTKSPVNSCTEAFDAFRTAGLLPAGRTEIEYRQYYEEDEKIPCALICLWDKEEILSFTASYNKAYTGLNGMKLQLYYNIYDKYLKYMDRQMYFQFITSDDNDLIPLNICFTVPLCDEKGTSELRWDDYIRLVLNMINTLPEDSLPAASAEAGFYTDCIVRYKGTLTGKTITENHYLNDNTIYTCRHISLNDGKWVIDGRFDKVTDAEKIEYSIKNASLLYQAELAEQAGCGWQKVKYDIRNKTLISYTLNCRVNAYAVISKKQLIQLLEYGEYAEFLNVTTAYNEIYLPDKVKSECMRYVSEYDNRSAVIITTTDKQ